MKRTIYLLLAAVLTCIPAGAQDFSLSTVVIDAGHGGTDPGAVSRDGKNYEKTFTLDIAKKLSDKIKAECPGVKVILTRDKDRSVALNDRAEIANKVGADLFISIHINSASSTSPNGYSVHVLGKSSNKNRDLFAYNMDVCKRENSVILLEDDYTTKYQGFDPSDPESFIFLQLMQNSNLEQSLAFAELVADNLKGGPISTGRGIWQDPFLVLWRTSMPAVLIELGFISNSTDLEVLKKDSDRDKIATRLCKAFKKYKAAYDGTMVLDVEVEDTAKEGAGQEVKEESVRETVKKEDPKKEEVKKEESVKKEDVKKQEPKKADLSGTRYGIQIFAGAKKIPSSDKAFLGYEPYIYFNGKLYKYIIAVENDITATRRHLPEVRKKYPDAFVVKIEESGVSIAH
ncbi:MAG: N-acetylmuramoyl-L-alanine amidase [Bacteroidales bacterium]|nr:N-acetylmuramoyl-L-alanine amidase [Bacteroidales bacterium]